MKVLVGGKLIGKTKTIKSQLSPTWCDSGFSVGDLFRVAGLGPSDMSRFREEEFYIPADGTKTVDFEVFDEDMVSKDDFLCAVFGQIAPTIVNRI